MVNIALLYLELGPYQLYQWKMSDKQGQIFSWQEFSKELETFYEQPCIGSYFTQLRNLKQLSSIYEYNDEHLILTLRAPEVTPYQRL